MFHSMVTTCWQQPCLPRLCPLLPALPGLQQVGHLNIARTNLQNVAALAKLNIIQGDLVVVHNNQLTSLAGLGPVTTLFGELWLDSNPRITDLSGLQVRQVPC